MRCPRTTSERSAGCCLEPDHEGGCCIHPSRFLTREPRVIELANGLRVECSRAGHP